MKVKVLKPFCDKFTRKTNEEGQILNIDEARAVGLSKRGLVEMLEDPKPDEPEEEPKASEAEPKEEPKAPEPPAMETKAPKEVKALAKSAAKKKASTKKK